MKVWKAVGLGGLILVAGAVFTYATVRLGFWNTSYGAMTVKYAGPPSVFVTVDGVPLHVRVEGRGPVVVMLHGSIVSLHEWDPVVERLKGRYRIVRIDWPPYGLSGPDPSGVYTTKRAADLVAGVVDQLHLPPFDLVSTSNGANVALQYAADHPGRVKAMAFSILPLERPSQTRKSDPRIARWGRFFTTWLPNYHPKFWYRLIVKDTTAPRFQPPPALVDMIYDMDNLPGAAARQAAFIAANTALFRTTDVGAGAGKVRAPVLIQWCALDTVISQSAASSVARFTHAPVQLIVYPDVGHFPMWEDPNRFSADLSRFLDRVETTTSKAAARPTP